MMIIDKIKLENFLKKNNLKLSDPEIDQLSKDLIDQVLHLKKIKKNKERKAKLDETEKKFNIDILSSNQKRNLPSWIKKQLSDCVIIGNSKKVILTKNGLKYHINNPLNDLPGNRWSYFLRSVINTRFSTNGEEGYAHQIRKIHPSPKPPQLMKDIIEFFTKENELVLDYFMGVGGTLLGASLCNRKALGIDLSQKYISTYKKASKFLNLNEQDCLRGNSIEILQKEKLIKKFLGNKKFSLIALDPPYGDMMNREKTGEAIKKNLSTDATPFTNKKTDLGNLNWNDFLSQFIKSIGLSMKFLKEKGHIVVFIKDLQPKDGHSNLLHADIINHLNDIKGLKYIGMKIWADESINLFPYGYPYSFVSNQLHQYIMFFRKI